MHTNTNSNLPTITIVDNFTYDHAGRLTKQTQTINGAVTPEVIAQNTYDELGQLASKGVGGKTTQSRLQTVDYTYNIRDWLKQINNPASLGNDLFAFKLNYNTPTSGTALYNGNISQTQWKTANTDNSLKTYTYDYDALNRITSGIDNTGNYNLTSVAYDKNGNITTLARKGQTDVNATLFGNMDILGYTYDAGNKLQKVTDTGNTTYGFKDGANLTTEYTYDVNGNMKTDLNKGITAIQYNYLNLPTQVTINGQNITYVYDATGVKLRKTVNTITTDYAGNFIYENNVLQFFSHPEGYIEPDGSGGYNYTYQYKDHLGNIRLSYSDKNNNGVILASSNPNTNEIVEENNYYPFGLKHKGYNNVQVSRDHKFEYNGKEVQDELGLNWIDYGARNYDPALGRWMNIDPLAEDYFEKSPYIYAGNNPVLFVDYDGKDFGIYIDHENNTITIRASYVVNSNDSSLMNDIASYWNGISGDNVFSVGEGVDAQDYAINFEVTVEVDDSEEATSGSDFLTAGYKKAKQGRADNPNSNEVNSLVTSSDYLPFKRNDRIQGQTGGNDAIVRKDANSKKNTGKHEIGHNFGMSHTSALMDKNGGRSATSRSVGETLSRIGLGSVRYGSRDGDGAVGSINGVKGTAPASFTSGSVMSKKQFDRRKNRAIKKAN